MLSSQESTSQVERLSVPSMTFDATSALNSAAAGYVAGVTGVVFGHPLDSAKVWLQTNTAGKNKHFAAAHTSTSTTSSVATTATVASSSSSAFPNAGLKRPAPGTVGSTSSMSTLARGALGAPTPITHTRVLQTVRALYSGISGPLFTVGIVQSINFATYDALRRVLHRKDHPDAADRDYLQNDSLTNVAIAGFVAGTGLAFVTSPLIMVKTRQQITGNGFRQAFSETLFPHGRINISRVFVGFYPHLISETVGRALYYAAYEGCKRATSDYKERNGLGPVTLQERMAAAGAAGISCWAVIFPFDSLRSRLYSQEGPRRFSTMEMVRVMRTEKAFYRGFGLTVLRAGPVAAAVLPVYDLVLEKLSNH
jgi:hypothetical protein